MSEYRIPDNAAVRVIPAEDGGLAIHVRMPGNTIVLLASINVALALSEELNRVTEIVCTGGGHG